MRTIEGNKLIDIFNDNYLLNRGFDVTEMNYHSDWNNLMPVVEKIKYLEIDQTQYYYHMGYINEQLTGVRLFRLWECVLEFIQWYSDQK